MAAAQGLFWDVEVICFHIKFLLGEMTMAPGSERLLEQSPHPGAPQH